MHSFLENWLPRFIFLVLLCLPSFLFAQSTVNLTLDDGSMDEEFQGTGSFTVTRDGSTAGSINVFVQMSGSAGYTTDFDYVNLTGYSHPTWYVHIPAGQSSTSVTLTPRKDNINEGVETVAFTLLPPVAGQGDYLMGAQVLAEMTILDDVAEVNLTLDDGSMDEEFQGTGSFTVTRNNHGNPDQAINVFVQMSGSAGYTTDFDYVNLTGYSHPTWYVHIPAGQSSTSVTLTPRKDNINEGVETVAFTLLPPVAGQGDYLMGAQVLAEMTILDDVAEVNLVLNDPDMYEAGQDPGSFTVTRDDHGNPDGAVNVFVEMSGTAGYTTDFDYVNLTGYSHPTWYVHIPAGQSSTTVTLTPITDLNVEGDESVIFTLQAPIAGQGDYIIGVQTTVELTIFDLVDMLFSDGFEQITP